jgi:hypothetical protein
MGMAPVSHVLFTRQVMSNHECVHLVRLLKILQILQREPQKLQVV